MESRICKSITRKALATAAVKKTPPYPKIPVLAVRGLTGAMITVWRGEEGSEAGGRPKAIRQREGLAREPEAYVRNLPGRHSEHHRECEWVGGLRRAFAWRHWWWCRRSVGHTLVVYNDT